MRNKIASRMSVRPSMFTFPHDPPDTLPSRDVTSNDVWTMKRVGERKSSKNNI